MKWWISDFDETLTLNPKSEAIESENIKFIERWTNKNNFIIAIGKNIKYIDYLIEYYKLKSKYKIANNGALLYKNNKLIFNQAIEMSELKRLFDIV